MGTNNVMVLIEDYSIISALKVPSDATE